MGEGVALVTSSESTANVTYNELVDRDLLHEPRGAEDLPRHRFLTTGGPATFRKLARRFLGPEVEQAGEVALAGGADIP
jgi:glutamate racemase